MTEDLSGLTIKGYELIERIGAGGFGAVYTADQSTVGRRVAVKIILPGYANQPDFIRRFESEARLIARLEHPYIVPLYDYWRDPSGAYLVMRWLRGGNLRDAIQERPYTLPTAAQVLDQVASGLSLAHRNGVVHRDIKPSNILLDEEGNAYLSDFGIAQDLRQAGKGSKSLVGTLDYVSPEQAQNEAAGPQSDIYSLGVTLYELLTGRHPYPGHSSVERLFRHINDPLPEIEGLGEEVNEVLRKATAKNPAQRYTDALEMAAAFRQAAKLDQDGDSASVVETLTPREQQILALIVEGRTNRQIAQELFIELSTVKWYISQIYRKLGVRSRVQAMVRARELRLVVPGSETAEPAARSTSVSIALPEPANPYKGLKAFEAADSRDFFGREALIEHLIADLEGDQGRFLAVVGPSGNGKSSLVKAGLIPAIWRGALPGSERWFVVEMAPGARPLDELEVALTRVAANQSERLHEQLRRDENGLLRVAGLVLPNDGSELVLIIDQFEELFTLVEREEERLYFLHLLQRAVSDPRSRVRVVIALRADFYHRPLQYPEFGELVRGQMETVLPLSAVELERAIVRPAEGAGARFEEGLVPTIIEDVRYQPGGLPLMQYALTELFDRREGLLLTGDAYEAIGGIAGALAGRAESLYRELDPEGQETVRQLFLQLTTVEQSADDGQTAPLTRRRVARSELQAVAGDAELMDDIIDTYAAYRLLSLDHDPATRRPTVEVAHEAILDCWERLHYWLEESRDDLRQRRRLERLAGDWQDAGRDPSFLLSGTQLDIFVEWAANTDLALTAVEKEFLAANAAAREERLAEEEARQRQELETAQQLAEAEKRRAEEQSQAAGRLRNRALLLAGALAIATILALAALFFARQAEEQRVAAEEQQRLATSRELASAAVANVDLNPERSILLALEAARVTFAEDGTVLPEVEEVLRQATQTDRVELTIPASGMLEYSPDGKMLAIGGENGQLTLWNAQTGDLIQELAGHEPFFISTLDISQDGEILVSGGFDSLVKIWHLSSGRLLGELRTFGMVNTFALNPDASQVAVALRDGDVQVWEIAAITKSINDGNSGASDPPRLREPALLLETPGAPTGVTYSPDGARLAAFIPKKSVLVWDPRYGNQIFEIQGADDAHEIEFSPSGDYLVAGSGDAGVSFWDARTGKEIFTFQETSPVSDLLFNRSGDRLATATHGGTVTLWDVSADQPRQITRLPGRADGINMIALHPDGRHLATGSDQGMTRIWDLRPSVGAEFLAIAAHEGEVYDAIYSPDGTQIASTGSDGAVRVWDSATGDQLLSLPGTLEGTFFPAYSPDGAWLAAANRDGGVSVWDARSGEEQFNLNGESAGYATVAFSPDGSQLAAAGQDGTATLWDMAGDMRPSTIDNTHQINRLVFDPDGQGIWSFDESGYATRWDANSGSHNPLYTEAASEQVCRTTLRDADIAQNGRLWTAASYDGNAYVFDAKSDAGDAQSFSRLYKLSGHSGLVTGTAFNPDGTVLATSSFDGSVKLWDMENGQEFMTLTEQLLPLSGVDFSPDGGRLITAGSDGTVSEYLISIDELIKLAQSRLSRELTDEECQTYLHQTQCPNDLDI